MIDIGQVHIAEPFSEIFPVDNKTLRAIQENITHHGFDEAEPLIVWKRNGKLVCVDGHTRYMAAQALGLLQVPVIEKSFDTDDAAVEYAIHRQRDRRNLSDAELWKCIEWMDKRKERGERTDLAQSCAKSETRNPKSAEQTAQTLGISARKVEQVRTVLDHGDDETKQAIEQGEISINKAYEETQKRRLDSKEKTKKQREREREIWERANRRDEAFQKAFDAFLWEMQRVKMEAWKNTSKEYALACAQQIVNVINV